MKKILMVSVLLFAVCAAADETEKLAEFMRRHETRIMGVAPRAAESFDGVAILQAEGARAYIEENDGLYAWRLLTDYWHDFDIDTTGATTGLYLEYLPNDEVGRLFPAALALWHSKPYTALADYVAIFVLASKINAGSSYLELSNGPDTLFAGLPGWDYSYTYRSGLISYAVKSHMLLLNGVAFNVFFLTTKTDFDDSISRLWYSLVIGGVKFSGMTMVHAPITGKVAAGFMLLQNYPNPFNAGTTIPLQVPEDGLVRVEVFDVAGRMVELLLDGFRPAGEYRLAFGKGKSSGVYFVRMTAKGEVVTRRMLLLR